MEIQKPQIILIGGGDAHTTTEAYLERLEQYDDDLLSSHTGWKKWLSDGLSAHAETIRPNMPSKENAYYPAWQIWFEKYFPYIANIPPHHESQSTLDRIEAKKNLPHVPLVLIGHSLGATFLLKYISEHGFPRDIDALHLIAPALDDAGLIGESLSTFSPQASHLSHIHKYVKHIHIWSSTDDSVVPYDHSVRTHVAIVGSVLHTFHDRGHFATDSHFVELFQEVLKEIHKD